MSTTVPWRGCAIAHTQTVQAFLFTEVLFLATIDPVPVGFEEASLPGPVGSSRVTEASLEAGVLHWAVHWNRNTFDRLSKVTKAVCSTSQRS